MHIKIGQLREGEVIKEPISDLMSILHFHCTWSVICMIIVETLRSTLLTETTTEQLNDTFRLICFLNLSPLTLMSFSFDGNGKGKIGGP